MNDILDDLKRYKTDAMRSQDTGRQIVYTRAIDEIEQLERENELLRAGLGSCGSWIERWTNHVGACRGGDKCTCGRSAVLYEARAAIEPSRVEQTGDGK